MKLNNKAYYYANKCIFGDNIMALFNLSYDTTLVTVTVLSLLHMEDASV